MGKEYAWFIEPLDSNTNDILASELPETDFSRKKEVLDNGKKRKANLWECDYPLVGAFVRSRRTKNFKFNIFVKEGGGAIRKWNLYPPPTPRLSPRFAGEAGRLLGKKKTSQQKTQ